VLSAIRHRHFEVLSAIHTALKRLIPPRQVRPGAPGCRLVAVVAAAAPRAPARNDEQERSSRRLLLDGSSSVRRFALSRRSLLSWTTTSSRDAGPGIIATHDCGSWRRIPRTIAIASMRLRSSRGRFLVALSLIAHCDSEARGRSC
jgi:hypothetical protein